MRIVPDLHLKMNIGNVEIELNGEGTLVHAIITEFRHEGLGELSSFLDKTDKRNLENIGDSATTEPKDNASRNSADDSQPKTKSKAKKKNTKAPQLLKDLNLRGSNGEKGLGEFVAEKKPVTNFERSTVFIYFLENKLHLTDITIDHVFSCYKDLGARVPGNLQQNLADISSSKIGYINTKDGKYSLTVKGSNFVEHDLPKKEG